MFKKVLEEMMDNVIRRYGFEAKETIQFCTMCERVNRDSMATIKTMYTKIMED